MNIFLQSYTPIIQHMSIIRNNTLTRTPDMTAPCEVNTLPDMSLALSTIEVQLSDLASLLNSVQERLDPVLLSDAGQTSKVEQKAAPAPTRTELERRLVRIQDRLADILNGTHALQSRILL